MSVNKESLIKSKKSYKNYQSEYYQKNKEKKDFKNRVNNLDNDYKLLVLELRKLLKRSKVLEQHTKIILDKIKQLKEFENLNKYLVKKESKEKKKVEFNEIVEDNKGDMLILKFED